MFKFITEPVSDYFAGRNVKKAIKNLDIQMDKEAVIMHNCKTLIQFLGKKHNEAKITELINTNPAILGAVVRHTERALELTEDMADAVIDKREALETLGEEVMAIAKGGKKESTVKKVVAGAKKAGSNAKNTAKKAGTKVKKVVNGAAGRATNKRTTRRPAPATA